MKKYSDLDSSLNAMPRFLTYEKDVQARGPKTARTRVTATPDKQYVFFQKNGKLCYKSDCTDYGGYWLDGLHGAVVCKQVDFLLPGVILELYCRYHCNECPLHTENDERQGETK